VINCNAATMAADKLRQRIFTLAEDIFPGEIEKNLRRHREETPDYRPPDLDFRAAAKKDRS
jgi:hypothetical protein